MVLDVDRKNTAIAGNEIFEKCIYLIHFRDAYETKWAHALIDEIGTDTIKFRTAANASPIEIQQIDILDIGGPEKEKLFDREVLKALYRGEIYFDSKHTTERIFN